jgi:hypothetical protein
MACHTITQNATDFLWSLKDHAFPPKIPNLMMQDAEIRSLKNLMQRNQQTATPSDKKSKSTSKTKPTPTPP